MLVLARKVGQVIRIADEVEVKVLEIKGQKVRLGILAPCDVPVHREEIYRRIEQESAISLADTEADTAECDVLLAVAH